MKLFSRVIATGSYLPQNIRTNADIAKIVDTSDEWIQERTGIKQRHVAALDETSASMAAIAAERAFLQASINPNSIDLIVFATCTPDRMFPSSACALQRRLGMENQCPAFDVSAACAGFNYALSVADNFIKAGSARRVLVIGSEVMSRVIDWSDRTTCILFGDGAGAIVLEATNEPGIYATHIQADAQYQNSLYLPNGQANPAETDQQFLKMNGNEVYKFAVRILGDLVDATLEKNGFAREQLNWLVPHQANMRIIHAMAKRLNLSTEQVITTIADQGNTSSASVPIAFDTAVRDGRIRRGDLVLFESFGGGFTWGSALIKY